MSRDPELLRLEAATTAALEEGRRDVAAEHHAEAATHLLQLGEFARAEFHLVSAIAMSMEGRLLQLASRYGRALGRLLQERGRLEEADKAYTNAAARGRMAEAPEDALKAEVYRAEMHAKIGRHAEALGITNRSVDYAAAEDRAVDLSELLRNRARHQMSLGQHPQAQETLGVAIQAADVANDPVQSMRLRWARHQLERGNGWIPTESREVLRKRHQGLGVAPDVGWEMDLLDASLLLHAQQPGPAADLARSARDSALEARELPLYLQACLLLGDIEVAAGRRHAALMVLLAAHQNLERILGPQAAEPVKAMMERFRRQWGDTVFDQAFAELQAHVEAQRPRP